MEPEEEKLLKKILKTSEENNSILKKVHRSIQWGKFFKIVYWVAIIGTAIGAFYFLQPLIQQLQDTFGILQGGV